MNFLLSTTSTSIYKAFEKLKKLNISALSAKIYASTASTRKTRFFVQFSPVSTSRNFTPSNTLHCQIFNIVKY